MLHNISKLCKIEIVSHWNLIKHSGGNTNITLRSPLLEDLLSSLLRRALLSDHPRLCIPCCHRGHNHPGLVGRLHHHGHAWWEVGCWRQAWCHWLLQLLVSHQFLLNPLDFLLLPLVVVVRVVHKDVVQDLWEDRVSHEIPEFRGIVEGRIGEVGRHTLTGSWWLVPLHGAWPGVLPDPGLEPGLRHAALLVQHHRHWRTAAAAWEGGRQQPISTRIVIPVVWRPVVNYNISR